MSAIVLATVFVIACAARVACVYRAPVAKISSSHSDLVRVDNLEAYFSESERVLKDAQLNDGEKAKKLDAVVGQGRSNEVLPLRGAIWPSQGEIALALLVKSPAGRRAVGEQGAEAIFKYMRSSYPQFDIDLFRKAKWREKQGQGAEMRISPLPNRKSRNTAESPSNLLF